MQATTPPRPVPRRKSGKASRLAAALVPALVLASCRAAPEVQASSGSSTESPGAITQEVPRVPRSPVSLQELDLLQQTVLFTDEDVQALRASRAVLEPHVEEILDTWYGFVASTPHLLHYFSSTAGEPQGDYLSAVRERFAAWILDTADARYDQDWLDYQYEIGLRHHRLGKNRTDGADAVDHIHFRYLPALAYPVLTTLRPFLERGGHSPEEVTRMHEAWRKSVLLQTILWSYPYVREGDF